MLEKQQEIQSDSKPGSPGKSTGKVFTYEKNVETKWNVDCRTKIKALKSALYPKM